MAYYAMYVGSWGQVLTTLTLHARDAQGARQEAQDRMPYSIRRCQEVNIYLGQGIGPRPRWVDPSTN